jgi:hypothetical protein
MSVLEEFYGDDNNLKIKNDLQSEFDKIPLICNCYFPEVNKCMPKLQKSDCPKICPRYKNA